MATVVDPQTSPAENRQVPRLSDSVITVRPTLIVGLGGTGVMAVQWAHHLIKELLGSIPPFIRFLGLDSDAQEEEGPSDLPESDFFNLFRTFHLGEVLRDYERDAKFHKHLSWLGNMRFDAAVIDRGCQGISRLGRLMFVENRDIIRRAVEGRYESLNGSRLPEQVKNAEPQGQFLLSGAPVVHVAASVCGGTGSGMLIDLAYALREWSRDKFSHAADIIGHVILPEAFNVGIPRIVDKLQAVAFATLRQIELLTESRRDTLSVQYRHGAELKLEPTSAPFSACYLVNGDGPGGSDDRKHLTELIGRMIRAMTVEPASKAIASDLNNKQTDILSQKDQKTRRLLAFSSYGLRYGTAGVPGEKDDLELARVQRWVCESLARRDTARRPGDADSERELKARFQRDGDLSFDQMVERMSTMPSAPFDFQPQRGLEAGQQLKQAANAFVEMLQNQFRTEAEQACPAPSVWNEFRAKYCTLAGTLGGAETANPDTSQEFRLLRNWAQAIRDQIENANGREWSAVEADYRDEVAQELQRKAAEKGIPKREAVSRLGQAEVSEIVNQVTSKYADELARAAARPKYREFLAAAAQRYEERAAALGRLANFANIERQRLESQTSLRSYWESAYATSLFELVHPEVDRDRNVEILADFNKLVFLVRDAFLAGKQADDTQKQLKRLQEILKEHDLQLQNFLANYKRHQETNFRRPVDKADPASHPFYHRVRDVAEGALPKISLDRKGRYDETLDMVVGQHSRESCIPQLLQALGYQHRSSLVSRAFEDNTQIWFQFMSFQYGFSLEAIDKLSQYREATKRYRDRAGYAEQDLWLDGRWFQHYQVLLDRCRDDSESHLAHGAVMNLREFGDHVTNRLQIALDRFFASAQTLCEEFAGFGNMKDRVTQVITLVRASEDLRSEIAQAQRKPDLGQPAMLSGLLQLAKSRIEAIASEARRRSAAFADALLPALGELERELKNLSEEIPPQNDAAS